MTENPVSNPSRVNTSKMFREHFNINGEVDVTDDVKTNMCQLKPKITTLFTNNWVKVSLIHTANENNEMSSSTNIYEST